MGYGFLNKKKWRGRVEAYQKLVAWTWEIHRQTVLEQSFSVVGKLSEFSASISRFPGNAPNCNKK